MDTIQIEGADGPAVATRARTRGWAVAVVPWVVSLVLGAALIWIVPRASSSRAASARDASLTASVARERSAAASASAALASTQARLADATQRMRGLYETRRHRATAITRLQAQAKKLRAEKARLTASQATSTSHVIVGKIGPPPPCHIVYYPDGSVGLKCG